MADSDLVSDSIESTAALIGNTRGPIDVPAPRSGLGKLALVIPKFVPKIVWVAASASLAAAYLLLKLPRVKQYVKRSRNILGMTDLWGRVTLGLKTLAAEAEQQFHRLLEMRGGGWHPQIKLLGRSHVTTSLESGSGAILWVYPLTYTPLVTKKALYEAGFEVSQVSTPGHNSLLVSIEAPYLAGRIVRPPGGSVVWVRELLRRLSEPGLVFIWGHPASRRILDIAFLEGTIRLPAGVAGLTLTSGAKLLPVFVVRRGWGQFDVVIEPPLDPLQGANRAARTEGLLRQYAACVESYVRRYPYQLHNLDHFRPKHRTSDDAGREDAHSVVRHTPEGVRRRGAAV